MRLVSFWRGARPASVMEVPARFKSIRVAISFKGATMASLALVPWERKLASFQTTFIAMGRTEVPCDSNFAIAAASASPGLNSTNLTAGVAGVSALLATAVSGQTAPWLIQSRIRSVWALVRRSPSFGMTSSSPFGRMTRRYRSLLSAVPGTSEGPPLPPLRAASRESRRSLDFCFSAP